MAGFPTGVTGGDKDACGELAGRHAPVFRLLDDQLAERAGKAADLPGFQGAEIFLHRVTSFANGLSGDPFANG